MSTLFIFGPGFSAGLFAKQALAKGWRVRATCRSAERADVLRKQGIEPVFFDGVSPIADVSAAFDGVEYVLHSIAPDKETGDAVLNLHGEDLERLESLKWMGYLSTTGVYGNRDGAMVDETSPCTPTSKRSVARKDAEDGWLARDIPVEIFRLAGIYGPGRSVFDRVRKGLAPLIDKPGQLFSRIHVDDIAGCLWASVAQPNPKTIYNVCDNDPREPSEVTAYAYDLLGLTPPAKQPFEEAAKQMSPMALTFWQDNKRVDNSRLTQQLGYVLKYPDFKSGLSAVLKAENEGNA